MESFKNVSSANTGNSNVDIPADLNDPDKINDFFLNIQTVDRADDNELKFFK